MSDAVSGMSVPPAHSVDFHRRISSPIVPIDEEKPSRVAVLGHRGMGSNHVLTTGIRENTVTAVNMAATAGADGAEFDVQITSDGVPVIFHDEFLYGILPSDPEGGERTMRVADITLADFYALGSWLQESWEFGGNPRLYGQTERVADDKPCTLEEFLKGTPEDLTLNMEIKIPLLGVPMDILETMIRRTLKVASVHGAGRRIVLTSFDPDACIVARKMQTTYPVMMLTNSGVVMYADRRRNSVAAAVKVAVENGLHGISADSTPLMANSGILLRSIKDAGLFLMTWGAANNCMAHVEAQGAAGVDACIVDNVDVIARGVLANHYAPAVAAEAASVAASVARVGSLPHIASEGLVALSAGV